MGALGIAFIAMFFRWIVKQNEFSWNSFEDWGHAYAIPLVSGYMIWRRRKEILREEVRAFWPGLPLMLVGMGSYLFFIVGFANHMLQGASMIIALCGMTLMIVGPRIFRHMYLPICYLGFAMTISQQYMEKITFQLQLVASKGAWLLLSAIGTIFGFFVDLDGNILSVGGHKLNVAEACSGMRMVVAFFALAAAVSLFSSKHWWQRIALLLMAAPVAIFMNVIRVAVLGLLAMWNPNLAAGDAHMMIGMVLLVPSLLLFMAIQWALSRLVDDEEEVAKPQTVIKSVKGVKRA